MLISPEFFSKHGQNSIQSSSLLYIWSVWLNVYKALAKSIHRQLQVTTCLNLSCVAHYCSPLPSGYRFLKLDTQKLAPHSAQTPAFPGNKNNAVSSLSSAPPPQIEPRNNFLPFFLSPHRANPSSAPCPAREAVIAHNPVSVLFPLSALLCLPASWSTSLDFLKLEPEHPAGQNLIKFTVSKFFYDLPCYATKIQGSQHEYL